MLSALKTIKSKQLFNKGEKIGIAVSGGVDSMVLLHFLKENAKEWGVSLLAITIDHKLRQESHEDVAFVKDYCKSLGVKCTSFEVDANQIALEQNIGIEEAARIARYGVFDALLDKGVVDKIYLGHHLSDQAETILLNLFRGAGLLGASGMDLVRGGYIRPLLNTTKPEIDQYAKLNEVPFVVDKTNQEDTYNRNFLRNKIMPLIKERFKGVEANLCAFAKIARQDEEYIKQTMNIDAISKEDYLVKIPLSYFYYPQAVINRMLKHCFDYLGSNKDIEKKHLEMIKEMAKEAENGVKINLPNKVVVHKEYDYVTILSKQKQYHISPQPLKSGSFEVSHFGKITTKRTYNVSPNQKDHVIDVKKVPANAVWRARQEGDMFTKFGGGTKKLKDYLIDKKVPSRLRDGLPVLASDHQVLVVAGLDISEQVKVDNDTKSAYVIAYKTK